MAIVVKPMANATGHRIAEEENRLMCRVDPVDKAFLIVDLPGSAGRLAVRLTIDK